MTPVLTLVFPTAAPDRVHRAADELRRLGSRVGEPEWLAAGRACDLAFDGLDLGAAEDAARRALDGEPVDLAAQEPEGRRKRLLVCDMESTVIRNEMVDELADFAGRGDEVREVTTSAMRGEIDFASALRRRVAFLAGLPVSVLEESLGRIEETAGAAALVATMRAHGAKTALVSGGFTYFTERVGKRLGFDVHEGNELEVSDGRLTGRIVEPVRGRDAKLRTLERLCRELGLEPRHAAAVGDGANDLSLLAAAGLGVAFRAKPLVAHSARFRVDHTDLTALLYFQGYRDADLR